MKRLLVFSLAGVCVLPHSACRQAAEAPAVAERQAQERGIITGRVRLIGQPPENPPISMRADPMCNTANAGVRAVQESVVTGPDGSLANVFIQLQGSFPGADPPAAPVMIDQRACVYRPRVVGLQLGQTLRVGNSDPGLHNVHGISNGESGFNIGQPMAGMTNDIHPKEEGLLRLQCDVHTWMVAFVRVVSHPYFAVTGTGGTFTIANVPVGIYTLQAWHEVYGPLTSEVRVAAAASAPVDLAYAADKTPQ